MGAADTARLIASLELDNRKFLRGAGSSMGAVNKLDHGLGRVASSSRKLAGGFAKAGAVVGGAIVVGLGASAKAAIDFQDAFQGVVKTVDERDLRKAGLTFDDLSDSIRQMAREMPNSAIELAGIAEQAGALGIKAGDIAAFTKQVAILASTTNISADDAAVALGQLQNVIGLTGQEFDNFAAALVDLGNAGASNEGQILEIARRAGSAAKLFGVAKDATLGWAAAAANLGINQELAGTSLQNVFLKSLPLFIKGSKTLRDVTGKTSKQLKDSFKKDAGGALKGLIADLGKLGKGERLAAVQKLFGKSSGITRLVLGLADSFNSPTGLNASVDESTKAWKEATAAQAEFDKRNATVRSSISRLKNNLVDAAISIGEGFAPALGRAADKLATFLKDKEFRKQLQDIGKDIGKAIDGIDWSKLLSAAKTVGSAFKPALDVVLKIADIIASLPPGVLGAGGALVITDKVTGGAVSSGIGGIFGGLGESLAKSLAAKIPVFGKAFVQPVFVTNQGFGLPTPGGVPAGGGGGGGGGAGGAKLGGTAGAGIFISDLPEHNRIVADVVAKNFTVSDPSFLNNLKDQQDDTPWDKILVALGLREPKQPATDAKLDEIKTAVNTSPQALAAKVEAAKAAQVDAMRDAGSQAYNGSRGTTSAVGAASNAITGAIHSSRPIITTNVDVNVSATTVEKTTTTSTRYGGGNGSFGGGGRNGDFGKGGKG